MNENGGSNETIQHGRRQATALLVRHAHTSALGRRLSGRTEAIGLSPDGRHEAGRLGLTLSSIDVAAIYTSPLLRAVETAAAIAQHHRLTPQPLEALQEIDFGRWSGREFAELDRDPRWHTFNRSRSRARIPGGETLRGVQRRMVRALRELGRRHQGQHFVVVSHADVIRLALLSFSSLPLDRYTAFDIAPASLTTLSITGRGRVRILDVNATVDLRPDRAGPLTAGSSAGHGNTA